MRVLALLIALLAQAADEAHPRPAVLRGARIYTVTGAPLDGATLVIENGRIAAVGRDVPVPAEADVIDVGGKVLVPGLIDAASRLFLPPGERSAGSAEQNVLDAVDFYQRDYREAVEQGVTSVYVGPQSLGSVNGLGAVLHLDEAHGVLLKDAALKLTLGASGGDTSTALERYQSYPQLKQAFEGARQYAESWEKYRKDLGEYEQKKAKKEEAKEPAKPRVDARNEILARALDSKQPLRVRIEVHTADAIALALRLAEEFKLRVVLEYVTEGGTVVAAIAKAKTPVVVGPVFRSGGYSVDYLHHSVSTASVLGAAGGPSAIGSVGDERAGLWGPGASRFLAESAALASSRGLSRDQALAAITIEAAKILGIDGSYGSIDKGKVADLVLLRGEPFESGTIVERTWINGESVFTRRAQ